jgi:hypothetical protein
MLQFLNFVTNLFLLLPWWGAVAVLISLAIGFWGLGHYLMYRFRQEIEGAIKEQGKPLAGALVTVHCVKSVEPPTAASPLDDADDEFDDEDLDEDQDGEPDEETGGEFATDDFGFFMVEVTIAPQAAHADWDPTALVLVPADFKPETEFEFSSGTALLHTVEVWRNGEFQSHRAGTVSGTQRLRMLFAIPQEVREAQFSYHFTTFGRLAVPARLEFAHSW